MNARIAYLKKPDTELSRLKKEKWLLYLTFTDKNRINPERLDSMQQFAGQNYILQTVTRQLQLLEQSGLTAGQKDLLRTVIQWSETAKGGLPWQRAQWKRQGFNLAIHNIGSAQIYADYAYKNGMFSKIFYTLIATHGLIGQTIRGEVSLFQNKPLYDLVTHQLLTAQELEQLLLVLNHCIIASVQESLWLRLRDEVRSKIQLIVHGRFLQEMSVEERLRSLRHTSIQAGEDFLSGYQELRQYSVLSSLLSSLFSQCDLWYTEPALQDFSFPEFCKILLLARQALPFEKVRHLSFMRIMAGLYDDHHGKKHINLYKKRIIEDYLSHYSLEDILKNRRHPTPHLTHGLTITEETPDTAFFEFTFSPAASQLIAFCLEAEKSGALYEKAIIMLYDLFGLRHDAYDRFYEETDYLQTMNASIDGKKVLLDYVKGSTILDIGPGGGALLDLLETGFPQARITGIDIADNVIQTLQKKKRRENHSWQVLQGDAFQLTSFLPSGSADTIIFCSILHELYSYIENDAHKFNEATLAAALRSAFDLLAPGGRILIRDGIMSEPASQKRRIHFVDPDGMDFLRRYARDFRGRTIQYRIIGRQTVEMPINDAMEFLYTYTWGKESYVHEINEQFGYFTPSGYQDFLKETLGETAHILTCRHYLQEGYTLQLSPKIRFTDDHDRPCPLPDSTCVIVIEKH